jgi:hypothetical protein
MHADHVDRRAAAAEKEESKYWLRETRRDARLQRENPTTLTCSR